MSEYKFYYDESEHSRKINYRTICASNYYDNFVSVIVGWSKDKEDFSQRYIEFETKYADRKDGNGEIKSTTLQQRKLKNGFASLDKYNLQFVDSFLSLFDENTHVYFSIASKMEYLVLQLFSEYGKNFLFDANLMKYSIVKALVRYKPERIIRCIDESPKDFLYELKYFFKERIEYNKKNYQLKQTEIIAFQQILFILDNISKEIDLNWDYHMSFDGFKKYLNEKDIHNYSLVIDKEGEVGEESKTLKAAREIGLLNVSETNSSECVGLRVADITAGVIAKLLKALKDSLQYQTDEESVSKKVLNANWFKLNDAQLELYKKLYKIICQWQPAWYKSYSGVYSDDLVVFIALLNFMNHFESVEEIQNDIGMQGEYFNAFACEELSRYFERRRY